MTLCVFHEGRVRFLTLLVLINAATSFSICYASSCAGIEDSTALLQHSTRLRPSQQRKSESDADSASEYYPYYPVQGQVDMVEPGIAQVWPEQQTVATARQQPAGSGAEFYDTSTDWTGYAPALVVPDYLSNGLEGYQNGDAAAGQYQYPSQTWSGNLPSATSASGRPAGVPPAPSPSFATELEQQSASGGLISYPLDRMQQRPSAAFAAPSGLQQSPQQPSASASPQQQLQSGASVSSSHAAPLPPAKQQPQMSSSDLELTREAGATAQDLLDLRASEQLMVKALEKKEPASVAQALQNIESRNFSPDAAMAPARQTSTQALGKALSQLSGQTPTNPPNVELESLNNLLRSLSPGQGTAGTTGMISRSGPALDSLNSRSDMDDLQKLLSSVPVSRENFQKIISSLGPSGQGETQVSGQMPGAEAGNPVTGSSDSLASLQQAASTRGSQNAQVTSEGLNSLLNAFATHASDTGSHNEGESPMKALASLDLFLQSHGLGRIAPIGS